MARKHDSGPRNDLAQLPGARLVLASEANEGQRFDEARLKEITGGDTITCRQLYRELFSYRPQFKLWLRTNAKPEVRGTNTGIWRRFRLIPFNVTIPEAERDGGLADKLAAELPGVFNWAVEGCLSWQQEGLNSPAAVQAATEEYRAESDTLAAFLTERCRLVAGERVAASWLYQAYRTWATGMGEPVLSQKVFGNRLNERGLHRLRSTGGRTVYVGISLAPAEQSDTSEGSKPLSIKSPHEGAFRESPGTTGSSLHCPHQDPEEQERLAIQEESA